MLKIGVDLLTCDVFGLRHVGHPEGAVAPGVGLSRANLHHPAHPWKIAGKPSPAALLPRGVA
jgi:hypothetical protein